MPAFASLRRGVSSWLPVAHAVVDLVLPGGCVACGSSGRALCSRCQRELAAVPVPARPRPPPEGLPPTWSCSAYEGVAGAVILAHKERGQLSLARPLGDALASVVSAALAATTAAGSSCVALVPMPSQSRVVRSRGHDPVLRISRRAAAGVRAAGHSVEVVPVLRVRRRVADQAGLGSAQRAANLSGALEVRACLRPLLQARPVLVLDDVITTGATMAEAARALRAAGGDVVGAAVIAATTRRSDAPKDPGVSTGA